MPWEEAKQSTDVAPWEEAKSQPQPDSLLNRSADAIRGFGDKVSQMAQPAMDAVAPYLKSQEGSPSSLLQSVPPLLNKVADQAGQTTSEELANPNIRMFRGKPYDAGTISPTVAGAAGTAVAMAPQIAMAAANPIADKTSTSEFAQNQALRAMGAPKRMFKTPQMISRAQNSAQTLLDQGAISGSAEGMADKLGDLESSSGQKIGEILNQFKGQGKFYDLQDGIDQMESLRPRSQNGQVLRGGQYDSINSKIDNAINTIKAHSPAQQPKGILGGNTPQAAPQINFDEANQLKGKLQDAANYNSNKEATLLDKVIAGKFRESLDNSLNKAAGDINDPQLAQEFQKHKQIYGATQVGKDAVYNKLASELANKKIGLTDWILGSHAIATGNPLTAIAEVGAKKLFEKYGASSLANATNTIVKTPVTGAGSAATIAQNVTPQPKTLDKETAKQFLDQANGDRALARQLAQKAGYSW